MKSMIEDTEEATNESHADSEHSKKATTRKTKKHKYLKLILIAVTVLLLLPITYYGLIFTASPETIRHPKLEHYHFRAQIIVDGKAENFADAKYQQGYSKDNCNVALPDQPFHFHDGKDQFVHVHWEGMTGGLFMKYYGWNYVGGLSGALGYRFDNVRHPLRVPIHGYDLPGKPAKNNFYIYTGDEKENMERSFDDWKDQDLEQFFGKTSNFPAHEINKQNSSFLNTLLPKVYAHGTPNDADGNDGSETDEEKLTRINNLLGNVVIFVQTEKPSEQQVKERFAKLLPLDDSTCGG